MVKKLLLLSLCGIFFSFVQAAEVQQNPQQELKKIDLSDSLSNNTIISKTAVSSDDILNDPKKSFKNLFTNSTAAYNGNTVRLNYNSASFVEAYIQKNNSLLEKMKDWAKPYFEMMDVILSQHGIPKELKYLAVIESHLKSNAVSRAGAKGPWQFMPATARNMGLKVGKHVDERTNYYKSTHAAASYLTELFDIYHDWLLVVAAYNCGPGNVNNAIRRSGSTDFWKLQYHLPTESRNHVKKFIATHYYMEGQGSIVMLTKDEARDYVLNGSANPAKLDLVNNISENLVKQAISGKYHSTVITKYILMNLIEFNKLNPDFDKNIANSGTYDLSLSTDKMELFKANKYHILNESIQLIFSTVSEMSVLTESRKIYTK